jgi:hypothetical protein
MRLDVNDPGHRAVLVAARAWGVSPSRFMGETVRTVTTHETDAAGTVLRSVTVADSDWTADDATSALDLIEYEGGLCPGCSQPFAETTDSQNEFAYKATLPVRCHRCTTSDIASEEAQKLPHPSALFIPIVLRGQHETDTDQG